MAGHADHQVHSHLYEEVIDNAKRFDNPDVATAQMSSGICYVQV